MNIEKKINKKINIDKNSKNIKLVMPKTLKKIHSIETHSQRKSQVTKETRSLRAINRFMHPTNG